MSLQQSLGITKSDIKKIVIEGLNNDEIREAVTVTQNRWYMSMLFKYKIYFCRTDRDIIPMKYILFYELENHDLPKSIKYYGKVSHLYKNVNASNIDTLPVLEEILKDKKYCENIRDWDDDQQIAIISEIFTLPRIIRHTGKNDIQPRIIVDRETTMEKALNARCLKDLFD